jgi:hypothetical protein
MYDWKYFVILVPASYVNVSENFNLHFAFYIISLLKFISLFKLVIAIKTITATKKVLNIIYGFKDNKQIISQLQFLLGFKFQWKQFVCLCKAKQALKFINDLT